MSDDAETKENLKPNILEIVKADDVVRYREIVRDDTPVSGGYANGGSLAHLCAMMGAAKIAKEVVGETDFDPWRKDAGGKLAIDHALAKNHSEIYKLLYNAMYPRGWFLENGNT